MKDYNQDLFIVGLKYYLEIYKYIIAICYVVALVYILFITFSKAEDFSSIVGLLIILIKLLLIYFIGIIVIYGLWISIMVISFILKISLQFTNIGNSINNVIQYIIHQFKLILDIFRILFYNTPILIIITIVLVVILILLLVLYIIYKIILELGFFFSFMLKISPFKELKEEGIFDFFDNIFSSKPLLSTILSFKPVKVAIADIKTSIKNEPIIIQALKEIKIRNDTVSKNNLIERKRIQQNGKKPDYNMSKTCSTENFVNYELDMIERFDINKDISYDKIEQKLQMCLLNTFTHKGPNLSRIATEKNKLDNKINTIKCNIKAEVEKSLV